MDKKKLTEFANLVEIGQKVLTMQGGGEMGQLGRQMLYILRKHFEEEFAEEVREYRDAVKKANEVAESEMVKRGPALWEVLHVHTDNPVAKPEKERTWLAAFRKEIGCPKCQNEFDKYMATNPPRFASGFDYFAWGVDFHNVVNARLQKRRISLEEARKRWRKS